MNELFSSKVYIDEHIRCAKELLSQEIDEFLVSDSTWYNDPCASLQISVLDETFLVFLPNSLVHNLDREQYTTYNLILDSEYAECEKTIQETFQSFSEVINHIIWEHYYA
jgi:hypothetical protein